MKIHYEPNPLASYLELDENDKRLMRLRVAIDVLDRRMHSMHMLLAEVTDNGLKLGDLHLHKGIDEDIRTEMNAQFTCLTRVAHMGDCLGQPFACLKCAAEKLAGKSTLPADTDIPVRIMFDRAFDHGKTLNGAILWLESYLDVGASIGVNTASTTKHALHWLQQYRSEYFTAWSPLPVDTGGVPLAVTKAMIDAGTKVLDGGLAKCLDGGLAKCSELVVAIYNAMQKVREEQPPMETGDSFAYGRGDELLIHADVPTGKPHAFKPGDLVRVLSGVCLASMTIPIGSVGCIADYYDTNVHTGDVRIPVHFDINGEDVFAIVSSLECEWIKE